MVATGLPFAPLTHAELNFRVVEVSKKIAYRVMARLDADATLDDSATRESLLRLRDEWDALQAGSSVRSMV
jgi:hypothetical protein